MAEKSEKKRPRNTRADGLKRVRLEVDSDVPGKRKQIPFYGHTLAECEEKKRAYLNEQEEKKKNSNILTQYGIDVVLSELTLSEWMDRVEPLYCAKGSFSTRVSKQAYCGEIRNALGSKKLKDIRKIDILLFASHYSDRPKSSAGRMGQAVRAVFLAALESHAIIQNPCQGVTWGTGSGGSHRYLEDWEISLITDNWKKHRFGLYAMLMLYAGLRRGEVMGLRWSDIDMVHKTISVERAVQLEFNNPVVGPTKTKGSVRMLPILPPLYKALGSLYGPQAGEYVCNNAGGSLVSKTGWVWGWRMFLEAMSKEIKIVDARSANQQLNVRTHDLRHTFCSMMYDAGVDVKTAQKLMGHSTLDMTLRVYTHLSDRKKQEGLDKLAQYTAKFTDLNLTSDGPGGEDK